MTTDAAAAIIKYGVGIKVRSHFLRHKGTEGREDGEEAEIGGSISPEKTLALLSLLSAGSYDGAG